MGRKIGGVVGLFVLMAAVAGAAAWFASQQGIKEGERRARELALAEAKVARDAKDLKDARSKDALAAAQIATAEAEKAKVEQQAKDDDRLRKWSDEVYKLVRTIYPRDRVGNTAGASILESHKVSDDDDWAFLVKVDIADLQRGTPPFVRAVVVNRGQMVPELQDEEKFLWLARPSEWLAERYAEEAYDDIDVEVVDVDRTGPESLVATVRERQTAKRFKLVVKSPVSYDMTPID